MSMVRLSSQHLRYLPTFVVGIQYRRDCNMLLWGNAFVFRDFSYLYLCNILSEDRVGVKIFLCFVDFLQLFLRNVC
jgi:hypothetical protein